VRFDLILCHEGGNFVSVLGINFALKQEQFVGFLFQPMSNCAFRASCSSWLAMWMYGGDEFGCAIQNCMLSVIALVTMVGTFHFSHTEITLSMHSEVMSCRSAIGQQNRWSGFSISQLHDGHVVDADWSIRCNIFPIGSHS
jgi:hypothetical protein